MSDTNGMPEDETEHGQAPEITALARMTYARHHARAFHVIMDDRGDAGRELRDLTNPDAWLTYTGPAPNVHPPDTDESSHVWSPHLDGECVSESRLEPRDVDIVLGQLDTLVSDSDVSTAITEAREALHSLETQNPPDIVAALGLALDALATAEAASTQTSVETDLRGIRTELLDMLDRVDSTR